ncbi:hypothetical protein [Deinococcus hopiensis]|uniref:Bacteriophage lambda head decoration protein D n=1 Tax=Deinococcus hopiensis KR-140 TaxID=695939 RepID=A0A1W1VIY2_9DEIO|nr:hypothetical protein [Deinococcus hopiensis]SMB93322.1 hypothetical protein SAMN00790413_01935 [Deinococcus hopiensis KR-140]
MTNIVRSPRASVDTTSAQFAQQHAGKILGEDVAAGQPMELRPDGKLWRFAGTANSVFFGIAPRSGRTGQPMTAYGLSTQFRAADQTLTIGKTYFLSDTVGEISDTAGTKDANGSFFAVGTSDLIVTRSFGKVG